MNVGVIAEDMFMKTKDRSKRCPFIFWKEVSNYTVSSRTEFNEFLFDCVLPAPSTHVFR